MKARFYRGDGQPQNLRGFLVRQPFHIAQHKDHPVLFGQVVRELLDHLPQLLVEHLPLDFLAPVLDRTRVHAIFREDGHELLDGNRLLPALSAKPHQAGVHADPVDPGIQRGVPLERVRLLEHRQKHVLRGFLGIAFVLQDRHRKAEDLPVKPLK